MKGSAKHAPREEPEEEIDDEEDDEEELKVRSRSKKSVDPFAVRTIKVAGQTIEFDSTTGFLIDDLDDDMSKVASLMAWWGSVQAAAEREKIEVDGAYRAWRASVAVESKGTSEYKIKNEIENHPDFMKFKRAIAKAEENVVLAARAFQALDKKANMLQSRGARERQETRAIGMNTPEEPKKRKKERHAD